MKQASSWLEEHDFRNFCKMDVGNGVISFKRKILSVNIREVEEKDNDLCATKKNNLFGNGFKMCVATIEGVAFLWHQIRSIMTVLFLVGEGKEEPSIIGKLLDVKNCIRKPQYGFASEIGLNLYDAKFDNVRWHYDKENLKVTISQLQSLWAEHATKESMLHSMLRDLSFCLQQNCNENLIPSNQHMFSHLDVKVKNYRPLMERPTCESLEERVEHYVKRRKLDASVLKQIEGCEPKYEQESEKTAKDKS
ncbi:tRNA pseudouridine(38/39) synthase [Armadillidium vulgare]|nr:tRNA pseudouridine(38/39) synthase [Armadillidium vulgare]